MKNLKNKKINKSGVTGNPSTLNEQGSPENAEELINKYGTYEIQPTADTENDFPAIAQGLPKNKEQFRKHG